MRRRRAENPPDGRIPVAMPDDPVIVKGHTGKTLQDATPCLAQGDYGNGPLSDESSREGEHRDPAQAHRSGRPGGARAGAGPDAVGPVGRRQDARTADRRPGKADPGPDQEAQRPQGPAADAAHDAAHTPETRPARRLGRRPQWRCIGPAAMGGRIVAFSVFEADPTTYWVATASGGLLKTTNNGVTFDHQFDHESTVSIGDVCVAPSDRNIVWVGTGENNPRNSVSYGDGVYKSIDGGKTWTEHGPQKDVPDRPYRRPSERPQHRLRRRPRPALRTQRGARPLQDHRRRQDVEQGPVPSTTRPGSST